MKCSSYGRNGGPIDREGCDVPQNEGNGPPTVETGVLLIGRGVAYRKTDETDLCWSATVELWSCSLGGVWHTAKRDSTGYCSSPPSTPSSLHMPLFIQPPPCVTPPATVQPPLHGHPSTAYCSSSPPRGHPIHPALHGVLIIQPPPDRSGQHHGVLIIHHHRSLFTPPPPAMLIVHLERQHRSALVSSSSEGIARSGSVNSHRLIARVQ